MCFCHRPSRDAEFTSPPEWRQFCLLLLLHTEKLLRDYLSDHPDVALRAVVLDAQDAKTSFDMPVVAQHLQTAPGLPYFILVNPKGKTIARSVDPARILKKIDKKR